MVVIENRLAERERALDAFLKTLPGELANAVGDHSEAIVAGIAESRALDGDIPPVGDDGLIRELAEVDQELEKLSKVRIQGPTSAALQEQRKGLVSHLEALRASHHAAMVADIQGELEQALSGSFPALGRIWKAYYRHPASFPDGLGDRIPSAIKKALTCQNPGLWVRCLESRTGRDF